MPTRKRTLGDLEGATSLAFRPITAQTRVLAETGHSGTLWGLFRNIAKRLAGCFATPGVRQNPLGYTPFPPTLDGLPPSFAKERFRE